MATQEYRLPIAGEVDVTRVTMQTRRCALEQGFGTTAVALLITSVSELSTNVLKYAGRGELLIQPLDREGKKGLLLRVSDHGPGIADLETALQDHHSTGGTLGLGLPGVRRMMDEFEIQSDPQRGTIVTVKKWI